MRETFNPVCLSLETSLDCCISSSTSKTSQIEHFLPKQNVNGWQSMI